MGWNLLRRTSLSFLLLCLGSLPFPLFSEPLPPKQGALPIAGQAWLALPPRQHHAPQQVWALPFKERPEIDFWLKKWRNELDFVEEALERFFPFRSMVSAKIREADMPPGIQWLSMVESAWRVDAVSSSGAVGPWQFLPASAKSRKLIIDVWRDERRDPWRSTEAALEELAFLYRKTNDWLLAMAAYNAGLSRLSRIQKETGISDFWGLYEAGVLPSETQAYIPRILALALLLSQAGREGLSISWTPPPLWSRVPLTRAVSFSEMSSQLPVSPELLRQAHAELSLPVTPPPLNPYALKVPEEALPSLLSWLDSLDEDAPHRFWRYTVVQGDSISIISAKTGIAAADLLRYNGNTELLRTGQRLLLPHDGKGPPPPGADDDKLPQWTGSYRVMPGDTLWDLARRFSISPEELAEANHRPLNGPLRAGSFLTVPEVTREP